ncbi:MAG TPA: DUF4010 domain-containing protein, partial [Steroidobacteraceae bacterium]|nr:DUF4010 domain-containing protein [Steroidobacteraceae bacterium]
MDIDDRLVGLAVALGIGLLIGVERERSKGSGPGRGAAGIRTFTVTSLAGALSVLVGGDLTMPILLVVLGSLVAIGYFRSRSEDPGLTTEISLLTAFLLGAWAVREPVTAAAVAVVIAILLASRSRLHKLVRDVLTDQEIHDGLMLAAAAIVILPLVPAEPVDPWGIVDARRLWTLAVLVMAINALGYVALRSIGPRIGLALAGFFSGFVSSTAMIGAMGTRAREQPQLRAGAVAGAALSSVATVVQLALVIGVTSLSLLRQLAWPLLAAGTAAIAYGAFFTLRSARASSAKAEPAGRPFDPRTAILFALTVGIALLASGLLTQYFGKRGLLLATSLTGFA